MKFLLDANLPRSIGEQLKQAGHDVSDIRDVLPDATDDYIYSLIHEQSRILITRDLDFSNVLRYPPPPTGGIFVLRLSLLAPADVTAVLKDTLTRLSEQDVRGTLVVISPHRLRIHRPPV